MTIKLNFTEISLDVFAGIVFGGLMYVITSVMLNAGPTLFQNQHLAVISGILMFAGMVFEKQGSKIYKSSIDPENK